MYVRLFSFIYYINSSSVSGFGTDIVLVFLIDKILKSPEEGEIVLGVLIHLNKAFDTVNHTVFLDKLHKYGIRGMVP